MTRPRRNPSWETSHAGAAIGVVLVALSVRLLHLSEIRRAPFFSVLLGDAASYDEWAQRLAAGDWIGRDVFYQAPLYPYFLGVIYGVFGHDLFTVRLVQAVVGSAACGLLCLAAGRFFSRRAGLLAGLGLALYAPAIFLDGLIQKTTLDVFFISLALWLISIEAWFGLGLTLGALSLTRENALVLAAVVLAWTVLGPTRRPAARARRVGAFVLGCALVLLPVAIRNYAVGGGFYLTTSQFGPNLYIGNNPNADGTYVPLRAGRGTPLYERQDATELAERAVGRPLTPSEVSSYWTRQAMAFVTSQPVQWLALEGRKFLLLWNAREVLDTESQETHAEWSWVLRIGGWLGHFGVLVPLALLGIFVTWPDRRRLWVLHAMLVAYAGTLVIFYVFARYRLPLVPLLMLFAAAGPGRFLDARSVRLPPSLERRRTGRSLGGGRQAGLMSPAKTGHYVQPKAGRYTQPLTVGALVAAVVFCNWPVLSSARMRAVTEANLAAALQTGGRLEDAIAHDRRAIALDPTYAPAHYNLGLALSNMQEFGAARAAFEETVRLDPDYAEAHNNLGALLQVEQRFDEAEAHYRQALALDTWNARARNNLAALLSDRGRLEEAARYFREALTLTPDEPAALFGLAWIHATAPSAPLRDPAEAIRLAERAVEHSGPNDPSARESLEAIYAAARSAAGR